MSEGKQQIKEIRINVLALAAIAAAMIGGLAFLLDAGTIETLAFGLITAIGTTLGKLVDPPAAPPPPVVPAESFEQVVELAGMVVERGLPSPLKLPEQTQQE